MIESNLIILFGGEVIYYTKLEMLESNSNILFLGGGGGVIYYT